MDNLSRHSKSVFKEFATLGFLGYLPASGTIGSLCGLIFFTVIKPSYYFVILLLILCIVSIMLTLKQTTEKDPKFIIIDEFIAVVLSCTFLPNLSLKYYISLFFLFRTFDIAKPWPIKQAENLPGFLGVLADDLLAGSFASLIIYSIIRLTNFYNVSL